MQALTKEQANVMLNKVPEVTLYFWIIKLLAVTVGETAADFLAADMHFGLTRTTYVMSTFLAICLLIQIRSRKYVPWIYWINVVLLSVVGTLITDNLVDNLGVSLETTTIVFSLALLATFAIWYASDRTLSIRSIVTTRRELFYWAAILFTFALGTSGGDLAAEGLGLGFGASALIFAAMIGIVAVAYYAFNANAILVFWITYILTRPLGASCGDLLSQSADNGGMDLGTLVTSVIFLAVIVALVAYLSVTRRDMITQPASEGGVGEAGFGLPLPQILGASLVEDE